MNHAECYESAHDAGNLIVDGLRRLGESPCHLSEYGLTIPVRHLTVTEIMDGTGERWILPVVSGGLEPWDISAIYNHAGQMLQRARYVALPG